MAQMREETLRLTAGADMSCCCLSLSCSIPKGWDTIKWALLEIMKSLVPCLVVVEAGSSPRERVVPPVMVAVTRKLLLLT